MLVAWAETGLVLAAPFRDGPVPGGPRIEAWVDAAYARLPPLQELRLATASPPRPVTRWIPSESTD